MQQHSAHEISVSYNDKLKFFLGVDPEKIKKLRMTDESLYSTTPYLHSKYIFEHISSFYNNLKNTTVTIAGSCIGGDILYSYPYFKTIQIVDISKLHCEITKHNIEVMFGNAGKLAIYNNHYGDVLQHLKQNIIMIDPPWHGVDYNKNPNMELYFTDPPGEHLTIHNIVKTLYDQQTEMIIIKLPRFYDSSRITTRSSYKHYLEIPIKNNVYVLYKMLLLTDLDRQKPLPKTEYFSNIGYRAIMHKYIKDS